MSGSGGRPHRSGQVEGVAWQLFDAWRATSRLGLGYFIREDRAPGDRKVELRPGESVSDLDDAGFEELWGRAHELTPSERRVVDEEGAVWLAQGMGPVWAEGGAAANAIGFRLRCISADRRIVERKGKAPNEVSEAELIEALRPPLSPGA